MKITLVDNLLLKRENDNRQFILQPHLGLVSLIAVLENSGYEAVLYDPKIGIARGRMDIDKELYRRIAVEILAGAPDLVGFTSLGCNFICTLKIARYLKQQRPNLPILLGGPHATVLHREIMTAYTEFDVIVRNESELKIVPVIEALAKGKLASIEGITYRENGEVVSTPGDSIIKDLDILPFPAYHSYPIAAQNLSSLRVEAGRGCPFSCTFCSTATFFGRSYRLKPAHKLCAELDFLKEQYGITDFGLIHDLFTVSRTKVIEFCNVIRERNYTWRCSARMDCVDESLLAIMRDAGCTSIYYGIEAGSQRMQKISKKKLDLSIFHEMLDTTLRLGIAPTLSFITGYPEETLEDANATLDMIGDCFLKNSDTELFVQLHLLTPEPGTALHCQYGSDMGFDDYISDFNFPTLEDDDANIMERHPEVFMNHHYYKTVLPRAFFVMTVSLFDTLLALGRTITRYLLGHYGNSLARLNADVYEWATANGIRSINNNLLALYISRHFSHAHVLTSLARYQFEVNSLVNLGIVENEKSGKVYVGDPRDADDSDPSFRLLKNIHDCAALLKRLEQKKGLPKSLLARRGDFVIHLFGEGKNKNVDCYELTGEALDIFRPIEARVAARMDRALAESDA